MRLSWLPWRYLIRHLAKRHGFLNPLSILERLEEFAQKAEVSVPVELLRAGVAFHARGLLNTKAIQTNLDWVWPYWVRRQFDPEDVSFVPRAFSATHVNVTHRNWTAVGLPGCNAMPIVDPRGLLTPFYDGWSLDAWILCADGGEDLLPSRRDPVEQRLLFQHEGRETLAIRTRSAVGALRLETLAHVQERDGRPVCILSCTASADRPAWLALSVRPYNPEGVSQVETVRLEDNRRLWRIEDVPAVRLSEAPDRHCVSHYRDGDVFLNLLTRPEQENVRCDAGLASAAALFRIETNEERHLQAEIDLRHDSESEPILPRGRAQSWNDALAGLCRLEVPDPHYVFLYETALRTLSLLSSGDVVPGPYTYKRFWFRDAAYMLDAMLAAGMTARVGAAIATFPERQTMAGYFRSQDGEWDSNGQVLWILERFAERTHTDLPASWHERVRHAVSWVHHKRTGAEGDALHAGLLPAGFSAEHLGNNDYYYWDDFWTLAGLHAAERLQRNWGETPHADVTAAEAESLRQAIDRSLRRTEDRRRRQALPASPYRRMDAGAVGSLAAGYPLQLLPPRDPELLGTVEFLLQECFRRGAFFQDMIHAGWNAYLTLHVAQVLLRAGDPRAHDLIRRVAELASPTGQWPEAIHPHTGGGCMGDGQHGWAAAEWVLVMRALFVREEGERLLLASGLPGDWLTPGRCLFFGPTPTAQGTLYLELQTKDDSLCATWDLAGGAPTANLEIVPPGFASACTNERSGQTNLARIPQEGPA